jgi:hypothetical protein
LPEKPEHSLRDSCGVLRCSDFCCRVVWYSDFNSVKRTPLVMLRNANQRDNRKVSSVLFLSAGKHLATKFTITTLAVSIKHGNLIFPWKLLAFFKQ